MNHSWPSKGGRSNLSTRSGGHGGELLIKHPDSHPWKIVIHCRFASIQYNIEIYF
jgi:hypothetical protein